MAQDVYMKLLFLVALGLAACSPTSKALGDTSGDTAPPSDTAAPTDSAPPTETGDDTGGEPGDTGVVDLTRCLNGEETAAFFLPEEGRPVDLSAALLAGSEAAPARYTFSEPGALTLCGATFYVNLEVQAALTLTGPGNRPSDAEPARLSGAQQGPAITVDGEGASLDASYVWFVDGDSDVDGAGLRCLAGAEVELKRVSFSENQAPSGGGLYSEGCALTLDGVEFLRNRATERGGGAALVDSQVVTDGIYLEENTAGGYGGGLAIEGGAVELDEGLFWLNSAQHGGGIWSREGELAVSRSWILQNQAHQRGGGLLSQGSALTLSDTSINENDAVAEGGGIYLGGGAAAVISRGSLSSNRSELYGGGVAIDGASATLEGCELDGNSATDLGGALYLLGGSAALSDSALEDTSATAIVLFDSALTLSSVRFEDNEGSDAGGLSLEGSEVVAETCDFIDNAPADLFLSDIGAAYSWPETASFQCDTTSCW
jgi:predicted outer membrane repeat protein